MYMKFFFKFQPRVTLPDRKKTYMN